MISAGAAAYTTNIFFLGFIIITMISRIDHITQHIYINSFRKAGPELYSPQASTWQITTNTNTFNVVEPPFWPLYPI